MEGARRLRLAPRRRHGVVSARRGRRRRRHGITRVVRGDDLLTSTPRQLALYAALGLRRRRSRTCRSCSRPAASGSAEAHAPASESPTCGPRRWRRDGDRGRARGVGGARRPGDRARRAPVAGFSLARVARARRSSTPTAWPQSFDERAAARREDGTSRGRR